MQNSSAPRKAFSSTSSSGRSSSASVVSNAAELFETCTMSNGIRTNSLAATAAVGLDCGSGMPVTDFYRDATVLITGGTGFVGKVLTEKLLRAFGLRKIYMLIRSKDNMSVQERLRSFFNESIFNTMRVECPELFEKVHPIRADYSAIDLDIDAGDRAMLSSEVQIVFNVVASVKFNEKLSDAIDINVLGTKKILDLAMEMQQLKSFVHISTLYCNCNRKFIKEQVYENEIGYEKIMQISRTFDDDTLEKLRHCLIGQMPNTYTMTKKCAENLVNHRAFHMPAGIFRPPIVMSTYKDPFPGWTDNLYGPSGLCTWSARGLVRCIYGTANCKANMVPADYVVNAMIASAWDIARRYEQHENQLDGKSELPVYNYVSDVNNITWGQYMRLARQGFHEPFDKALCYVKAYQKISRIIDMMAWFGLKEWKFAHRNIDELSERLPVGERAKLQFNIATINWSEYFRSYLSGIRRYFFKDNANDNKLQQRKTIYRRMLVLHTLLKTTFGLSLIMCIVRLYLRIFQIMPKIML
ncbi:fatty acyl-CoA reductase wat isoform X2 [Drosophila busckii]|uniref:fatty acyl-CoA reductase wat isoform X2 n=1 Tax=Drosophila busckii TaxID=30019 RepID=UPI00083F21E5|nr:fatty acyl-CoA reductase wat isoform X2 [Drosophila busckii]